MEEVRVKVPPGRLCIPKAKCPNGHSLIDDSKKFANRSAIAAKIRIRGLTGFIYLSPFFGDFQLQCQIALQPGDIVHLSCPICGTSLMIDTCCRLCNVPMFALQLPNGGEVQACPVVGCRNHQLTIVDLDAQFAGFYDEETRPKM